LYGEPVAIAVAIATAVVGVWAATVGIAGYLRSPLPAWQRLAMAAGGLALLIPPLALPGALWINVAGAAVVGLTVAAALGAGRPSVSGR
jgi:TRAP-type uncharacterized transport system fused permease subunit